MAVRKSHKLLDRDDWSTNFVYVEGHDDGSTEILFAVSASRTTGRWFGYVFSLGISAAQGGNTLSEVSIEARGEGADEVIEKLYKEYEIGPHQISPDQIKTCIRRNEWYVEGYEYGRELRVCTTGSRVHITIRKYPPPKQGGASAPLPPRTPGVLRVSDLPELQRLLVSEASKAHTMGTQLGLLPGVVDALERNAQNDSFRFQSLVLTKWLERTSSLPTVKELADVLEGPIIGNESAAQSVRRTFKSR